MAGVSHLHHTVLLRNSAWDGVAKYKSAEVASCEEPYSWTHGQIGIDKRRAVNRGKVERLRENKARSSTRYSLTKN